jgi:hypothetical protein
MLINIDVTLVYDFFQKTFPILFVIKQLIYLKTFEFSIAWGNQKLAISRYLQQTKDLCAVKGKQAFKVL